MHKHRNTFRQTNQPISRQIPVYCQLLGFEVKIYKCLSYRMVFLLQTGVTMTLYLHSGHNFLSFTPTLHGDDTGQVKLKYLQHWSSTSSMCHELFNTFRQTCHSSNRLNLLYPPILVCRGIKTSVLTFKYLKKNKIKNCAKQPQLFVYCKIISFCGDRLIMCCCFFKSNKDRIKTTCRRN